MPLHLINNHKKGKRDGRKGSEVGGLMTIIIVKANKSVTLQDLGRAVKKKKKHIKRLIFKTGSKEREEEREKQGGQLSDAGLGETVK